MIQVCEKERERVSPLWITLDLALAFIKLGKGVPVHLGGDPKADLGDSGEIISLGWPGYTLRFSQRSWWKWLGTTVYRPPC